MLNKNKLESDIKNALSDSIKKSQNAVFSIDENITDIEQIKELLAKEQATTLSEELAPKLATIIDSYVRSVTLIPKLTAPNGPVTGTIDVV